MERKQIQERRREGRRARGRRRDRESERGRGNEKTRVTLPEELRQGGKRKEGVQGYPARRKGVMEDRKQ